MNPEDRRKQIAVLVRSSERVSVDQLHQRLGCSRETIRRDLQILEDRGLIRKYHGGATALRRAPLIRDTEGPFTARMHENTAGKLRMASLAAALFDPGDSLLIDTGTTTVYLAEELARREGLTVITNSLTVASLASGGRGAECFVIGGKLRPEASELLGPLALRQIANFKARHAVITVGAVGPDAFMDFDVDEAEIARAMIAQAQTLTILADSSKIGQRALFEVCAVGEADRLVTDAPLPPAMARTLADAGVEVLVAEGSDGPA